MIKDNLKLFDRSKDNIWTDKYVSRNMLAAHLDGNSDAASRNVRTIEKTIKWIKEFLPKGSSILDLGCGPGLYSLRLALEGYIVHGIDINQNSIDYAASQIPDPKLPLTYQCTDYLRYDDMTKYDAVIMIYCDMGALTNKERDYLLSKCYSWLNDDGILVFDVFDKALVKTKKFGRTWHASEGADFWSEQPYIMLTECKHFEKEEVIGNRSIIIGQDGKKKEYITWDHYYTEDSIRSILERQFLSVVEFKSDLVEQNSFTSNSVMFIRSQRRASPISTGDEYNAAHK